MKALLNSKDDSSKRIATKYDRSQSPDMVTNFKSGKVGVVIAPPESSQPLQPRPPATSRPFTSPYSQSNFPVKIFMKPRHALLEELQQKVAKGLSDIKEIESMQTAVKSDTARDNGHVDDYNTSHVPITSNSRLDLYRTIFDRFIEEFSTYRQLFIDVKTAYEAEIDSLVAQVKSLLEVKKADERAKLQTADDVEKMKENYIEEIRRLKQDVADALVERDDIKSRFKKFDDEIYNLQFYNKNLQKELDEKTNLCDTLASALTRLDNEMKEQISKEAAKDAEIINVNESLQKGMEDIERLRQLISDLEASNSTMIAPEVYERSQERVDKLQFDLKRVEATQRQMVYRYHIIKMALETAFKNFNKDEAAEVSRRKGSQHHHTAITHSRSYSRRNRNSSMLCDSSSGAVSVASSGATDTQSAWSYSLPDAESGKSKDRKTRKTRNNKGSILAKQAIPEDFGEDQSIEKSPPRPKETVQRSLSPKQEIVGSPGKLRVSGRRKKTVSVKAGPSEHGDGSEDQSTLSHERQAQQEEEESQPHQLHKEKAKDPKTEAPKAAVGAAAVNNSQSTADAASSTQANSNANTHVASSNTNTHLAQLPHTLNASKVPTNEADVLKQMVDRGENPGAVLEILLDRIEALTKTVQLLGVQDGPTAVGMRDGFMTGMLPMGVISDCDADLLSSRATGGGMSGAAGGDSGGGVLAEDNEGQSAGDRFESPWSHFTALGVHESIPSYLRGTGLIRNTHMTTGAVMTVIKQLWAAREKDLHRLAVRRAAAYDRKLQLQQQQDSELFAYNVSDGKKGESTAAASSAAVTAFAASTAAGEGEAGKRQGMVAESGKRKAYLFKRRHGDRLSETDSKLGSKSVATLGTMGTAGTEQDRDDDMTAFDADDLEVKSFGRFFDDFLWRRLKDRAKVLEFAYNFVDALKKLGNRADFKMFLRILNDDLQEDLWPDWRLTVARLKEALAVEAIKRYPNLLSTQADQTNALTAADNITGVPLDAVTTAAALKPVASSSGSSSGSAGCVPRDVFMQVLRKIFLTKPDESFAKLAKILAMETKNSAEIDFYNLLDETGGLSLLSAGGGGGSGKVAYNQGRFYNALCEQHIAECSGYVVRLAANVERYKPVVFGAIESSKPAQGRNLGMGLGSPTAAGEGMHSIIATSQGAGTGVAGGSTEETLAPGDFRVTVGKLREAFASLDPDKSRADVNACLVHAIGVPLEDVLVMEAECSPVSAMTFMRKLKLPALPSLSTTTTHNVEGIVFGGDTAEGNGGDDDIVSGNTGKALLLKKSPPPTTMTVVKNS